MLDTSICTYKLVNYYTHLIMLDIAITMNYTFKTVSKMMTYILKYEFIFMVKMLTYFPNKNSSLI